MSTKTTVSLLVNCIIFGLSLGMVVFALATREDNKFKISDDLALSRTSFDNTFSLVRLDKKVGFIQIQGQSILFVANNNTETVTISSAINLEGDEKDVALIVEIENPSGPQTGKREFHQFSGLNTPPSRAGLTREQGSLFYYFESFLK